MYDNHLEINLNRERVYNALNRQAKLELIEAIKNTESNKNIKSIIITASGKAFCTGQDLSDRAVTSSESEAPNLKKALEEEWNPLIKTIRESSKLIIGSINGMAVGAGMSVALSCDYLVCHPETYFMAGFSKIGLVPDAGLTKVITSTYGRRKALEILLLNKTILMEEALSIGLINEINENHLDAARELSKKVSSMAPLSIKETKRNILFSEDADFVSSLNNETTTQCSLGKSRDYAEGVKAFFEKRKPQFIGS